MINLGSRVAGSTVYIPFHTFNSSGASVTLTGLAVTDVEIYKNGSIAQRASDAGITLLDTDGIDFDGITGLHGFKIDLSDNTDAGFFAAGSNYMVAISAVTVDGQTVNFWAAMFDIVAADATIADIADAVWDEATAGHATAGSTGKRLSDNGTAVDAVKVKTDFLPGAAAGAAGGLFIAGSNAATTVNITGNVTGNVSGSVGSVTGAVGSVTGAVGSLAAQAKADVNAEVLDVMNVDTFAEPAQGAPAATASLAAKIGMLYKAWRNKKTQTATDFKLFADDATTVDQKCTVSDDGTTATKGEIVTGP